MPSHLRLLGAGFAAAAGLLADTSALPQELTDQLNAADRRTLVEAAADALRLQYVFPDTGERAAETIEAALAEGRYDDVSELKMFAKRLTEDLQEVTKDKHLNVRAPGLSPADRTEGPPRGEGGVARADRLPKNIGYLEVFGFPPLDALKPAVDRAMMKLSDTRALIIDLRNNGGGDPATVSYLVSFFLDNELRVHINDIVWRNPGTTSFSTNEYWSVPTPTSYLGKPVFVLTSEMTFSGGEEFAYDIQGLGLGTLVGEITGGGAHPTRGMSLGKDLTISVPGGRARNPITGTNWEGVGVKPDIISNRRVALSIALDRLGLASAGTDIDSLSEERLF